jgi:hypothetical protein
MKDGTYDVLQDAGAKDPTPADAVREWAGHSSLLGRGTAKMSGASSSSALQLQLDVKRLSKEFNHQWP